MKSHPEGTTGFCWVLPFFVLGTLVMNPYSRTHSMKSAQLSGSTYRMGLRKAPLKCTMWPLVDGDLTLESTSSPFCSQEAGGGQGKLIPMVWDLRWRQRAVYKWYTEGSQVFITKLFYNIVPFQCSGGRLLVVALFEVTVEDWEAFDQVYSLERPPPSILLLWFMPKPEF